MAIEVTHVKNITCKHYGSNIMVKFGKYKG